MNRQQKSSMAVAAVLTFAGSPEKPPVDVKSKSERPFANALWHRGKKMQNREAARIARRSENRCLAIIRLARAEKKRMARQAKRRALAS